MKSLRHIFIALLLICAGASYAQDESATADETSAEVLSVDGDLAAEVMSDPDLASAQAEQAEQQVEGIGNLPLRDQAEIASQVMTNEDFSVALENWDRTAEQAIDLLQEESPTDLQLDNMRKALVINREQASAYVFATQSQVNELQNQLDALKPSSPTSGDGDGGDSDAAPESDELKARRDKVSEELADRQGNVLSANQVVRQANGLIEEIDTRQRLNYYNSLLSRSGSPLSPDNIKFGAYAFAAIISDVASETKTNFSNIVGTSAVGERWLTSALLILLSVLLLFWLPKVARMELRDHDNWTTRIRRLLMPLAPGFVALIALPTILNLLYFACEYTGIFGREGLILLDCFRVWGFFLAGAVALRWFIIQQHSDSCAAESKFGLALYTTAIMLGIDWTLAEITRIAGLPAQSASTLHFILLGIGSISVWSLTSEKRFNTLFGHTEITSFPTLKNIFRLAIRFGVIIAFVLSLLGYFAASYQLFRGVISTGYIIFLAIHATRLIVAWLKKVFIEFKFMDPDDEEDDPHDKLWPVLIQVAVWAVALPLIALSWGVSRSALQEVWNRLRAGVSLGDIQLSLGGIVKMVVIFYLGYLIVNGLKKLLNENVLKRTHMDVGARTAVTAISGYIGYTIVAFIALTSAGLDLSAFAYIAGALSVGIGFGLQNIVQNFISGIILLIERPIRKGDWIKVGNAEGYVHNIAVRATSIKTFDDSTITVPNADIITQPVTNWFTDDQSARVTASVSVAYGCDPEYVEKILLETLEDSTYKRRDPNASVIIRQFGPSSVDFELRYWIRNADFITRARSESYYSMIKRFDEAGIVMPFPQREVRILNESTDKDSDS